MSTLFHRGNCKDNETANLKKKKQNKQKLSRDSYITCNLHPKADKTGCGEEQHTNK